MKRLSESQLRRIIKDVYTSSLSEREGKKNISEAGASDPDVDQHDGFLVAEAFFTLIVEDERFKESFVREVEHFLDDESFFPWRIEDVERMADSVARHAVSKIAIDPDFKGFISEAVARVFRKSLA